MSKVNHRPACLVKWFARGLLLAAATTVQESAMAQSEIPTDIAATAAPVVLRAAAVTVPLVPAAATGALKRRLAEVAPGQEIRLVIDGLHVDTDPGALYRIELVAADDPAVVESVGSFNVFGISHAQGATAQRSFVVTAPLRRLGGRGFAVRFVPDTAVAADAKVSVGRIALVAQ
jgi:hypothetical protein